MTNEEYKIIHKLINKKRNIKITRHEDNTNNNIYRIERSNEEEHCYGFIVYRKEYAAITIYKQTITPPRPLNHNPFRKTHDIDIKYDDPEYVEKINTIINGEQNDTRRMRNTKRTNRKKSKYRNNQA